MVTIDTQSQYHSKTQKSQTPGRSTPIIHAADLKSGVDCRDIFRLFWGQPKRSTALRDEYFSQWRDDGQHASVKVTHYGYRDFGGAGDQGDIYTFLQRELNLTFSQAVEWVLDYTHSRPVNAPTRPRQERAAANEPPSLVWQNSAINFIEASARELWRNPDVLDYLRKERLFTDETINFYRLGWNPIGRKVDGYWVEPGIVIPRYQDGALWLVNIRTVTGALAEFWGVPSATRRDGTPIDKYICMAGSKLIGSSFNADALQPGRPILFVEGELDCILAQQEFGESVSVVTLGGATNRIAPTMKARLLSIDAPIYIALDSDGAGQGATRDLITELGERATALRYPAGYKDFTDFLNAGGDANHWLESQTNSRVFADGAPAAWVSRMKAHLRPGAALLFVAMQQAAIAGAIDAVCFTAPDLLEWMHENGYPIAKRTFYNYLESCDGELVQKCKALSYNPTQVRDNALHFGTNPNGKPAESYCMAELSYIQKVIRRQSWARLYDREFKTDGKTGIKARPRVAGLIRLGLPAAIAPKLDKAYEPIYRRQSWAYRYAEKRIQQKHAAIIADLADLTPLKTDGYLIKRQSDLDEPIIQSRLTPGQPTSLKQIAQWTGKHHTRVGHDLYKLGYEGQRSANQTISIQPRQDIKQAALEAVPNGRWVGLMIDDNPEIQPFEQSIANRATKSIALVIQPPNTYTFVGKPEPIERVVSQKKIDMKQSKAAPEYKPTPYWGDDVNPEVDHNQVVLGLHLTGWEYQQATGFWIHPDNEHYCRTLPEAVLIQAGEPIEALPIVDAAPKMAEICEIAEPYGVGTVQPVETPQIACISSPLIDYRAMNKKGRQINPFAADYDASKLIYQIEGEHETE